MWALVITLCTGIAGSPSESCNDYVRDTLANLDDCKAAVTKAKFTPDMVELSCRRGVVVGADTVQAGIESGDFKR